MKLLRYIAPVACGLILASTANAGETMYFYSGNRIVFAENSDNIARVAYEDNGATVAVYAPDGTKLFSSPKAELDYMSDRCEVPAADLLDIVFNEDGTATDVSPMKMAVKSTTTSNNTFYSPSFGRQVARFDNPWGTTATNFYRIDYTPTSDFGKALADGHTLEIVVMADFDGSITDASNNVEAKPFASHEAGGTGFLISKKANGNGGKSGKNVWTFLPNISTSGSSTWRWATSLEQPVKGEYVHLVGVWSKEDQKAYIYLNGELKYAADAPGDLVWPKTKAQWFAIGGDSSESACKNGWKGNIAVARIYDKALDADEINNLWFSVKPGIVNPDHFMVEDIKIYSGLPYKAGIQFPIYGKGFEQGDKFFMSNVADMTGSEVAATVADGKAMLTLPADIAEGNWWITMTRGTESQLLGRTTFAATASIPGARVIAHRGYWDTEGSAQNSRAALAAAQALECYGAETDIWLTTDGRLMVNHDKSFGGVTIASSTYDQCKNLTLANGEKMPCLEDFLEMIKTSASPTKLIIEIKKHSTVALNQEAAKAAVAAVKAAGVQDKVEYISFDINALDQVLVEDPEAICAYLDVNYSVNKLKQHNFTGIDFKMAELRKTPSPITLAHDLGMTVNAWTVNTTENIIEFNNLGVDFITTDAPEDALAIKAYYDQLVK